MDGATNDQLAALLQATRAAGPGDRIGYRNQLVAFGQDVIEPMAQWLTEPRLGAFAVRVLEQVGRDPACRPAVVRALIEGREEAATPSIAACRRSSNSPPGRVGVQVMPWS